MPDSPVKDDILTFLDDDVDSTIGGVPHKLDPWRVLSVDDDEDVHVTTQLALDHVEILGKPVELLRAYSAKEALEVLATEKGIAVVLLDVVMEDDHAGLDIVDKIRNELGLVDLRIVLRTGQPGYAPELEAIRDYDINDYRNKSELTHTKLYTTLTSVIRSYSQIRALEASRKGLELITKSSGELINSKGFDGFSLGIITQLSALLDLSDDGIVCTRANDDSNPDAGYTVVAATGRYQSSINNTLDELKEFNVKRALEQCIQEKKNLLLDHAIVLYISGQAGCDLIAFLDQTRRLDDTEKRLLDVFCSNISVCLNNVLMLSKLHRYAYFDSLLDIPNRLAFVNCIEEYKFKTEAASVVLVDVDQFSAINDTIGILNGDFLLGVVAQRLADKFKGSFLARISGDVFGLVGARNALRPKKVKEIFSQPFEVAGQEQLISVTLGLYDLDDKNEHSQEALKKANIALKKAKESLRGSHCYFTREMEQEAETRFRLLHNLRKAFDADRLFMMFQPQVSVADGRPVGVEALLRWRTEEGEMVPPDRFIPLAESSGLIIHLGEWVLRTAMLQLKRLQHQTSFNLRMGINVSMDQFRHPEFLDVLDRAIAETAVNPQCIELEVTESVAMIDRIAVNKILSSIASRGIKIAIDDFGTGFSSLSYLERLAVHRLKIDKSFIDKLQGDSADPRLAEMIVNLAKDLSLDVIAEGVELAEQAEWLKKINCDEAQGYFYARPLEEARLIEWLHEQEQRLA
ncbi:bifunctional diguanylate cyclase/phosphodiesterase [Alkalimarinus alittae]|uniref:EAL domain-containing protein n=1 Tax=Alkalimarinus alittae TaxID=2961619 RepID=A0ABY6N2T1_9ALTE|nr:EAL domain-containing protein [Alkalimarinus alittae]UZE96393.1 EAL domain-containing protein [Alkalimarinus alittae]